MMYLGKDAVALNHIFTDNARIDSGTFTPTAQSSTITVQHNLGATPHLFFCYPINTTAISQNATNNVSYWCNIYNTEKQIVCRSQNGVQFSSTGLITLDAYISQPTNTEIKFGGTSGTMWGWAINEPYEWYAFRFDNIENGGDT